MIEKIKKEKLKITVFIGCIFLLVINGKFQYRTDRAKNLEKMPQFIINHTNYILEQESDSDTITVLSQTNILHSLFMRQLSSKIELISSRSLYAGKIQNEVEKEERIKLEQSCYSEAYRCSIDEYNKLLEKHSVDWVIVKKDNESTIKYIDGTIMKKDCEIDGYILYKR